jgi:glycosyltransferase involved in cell wall biosynthesis
MREITLAYVTNMWSHFQATICRELSAKMGADRFKMVLCEPVYDERRQLGWDTSSPTEQWVLGPPGGRVQMAELREWTMGADVAVIGSAPPDFATRRAASGRLTLIMSERLWKRPWRWTQLLRPRTALGVYRFRRMANRSNVHYLAIGAGAPSDVRQIRAFDDRIWTWPYFAEAPANQPEPRLGPGVRILWVGRMIPWKRVDLLLEAVAMIRDEPGFEGLDLFGTGDQQEPWKRLAQHLGLGDKCGFHGPQHPSVVRRLMREADIYVLASDRNEGWGVVANEAMSEGCVLVANREAGAARVLIKDGITGFLFDDGNSSQLADILRMLVRRPELRERVRAEAFENLVRLWHPRVGAERLIALCQGLLGLVPVPDFAQGPCSRAIPGDVAPGIVEPRWSTRGPRR